MLPLSGASWLTKASEKPHESSFLGCYPPEAINTPHSRKTELAVSRATWQ
jgi:hypothetical protein